MGVLVHAELADSNERIIFFVKGSAQDCFDSGHNFIQAERLRDIVVATHS
jgi:hypothetical protein